MAARAGELLRLNISVPSCETKQPFILESYQIFPAVGIGLLLSMNVVGTAFSLYRARRKLDNGHHGPAAGFLDDFNTMENVKKILDTSRCIGSLDILHGMKFITLTWIILGHTYCNTNLQLVRSVLLLPKFPDSFAFTALMNGTLSVDSFFFISGLLVTYTVLKKSKGIKTINIPLLIFHRLWRIIPGMMVCVCLLCFLPWMGSGPLWHELVDPEVKGCRRHWWTNILFINNFVAQDEPCLEHTWFLADDFQFYLLSLPVVVFLLRWPTIGLTVNIILIILSMMVTGYITYAKDFTPTILMIYSDPEFRKRFNRTLYFKPYAHAGPYFVGLAVGYLIGKYSTLKPTKIWQFFGNLVVSFFLAFVVTVLFEVPLRSLEKHLSNVSIKRKTSSFTLPRSETKWPNGSEKEMSRC